MNKAIILFLAAVSVATAATRPTSPVEGERYVADDGKPWVYSGGAWLTDWTTSGRGVSVMEHGAKGDGIRATDGAITASDATFTSAGASFVTADIGKHIRVAGAGASGADLRTTIASINSGTSVELTATAGTTVSGARYIYGTDDTVAIQAAIDVAETQGAVTVFFPDGHYIIAGALQETGGGNAQLLLPTRNTDTQSAVTVRFQGESPFYMNWPIAGGNYVAPTGGVVLESTLTTGTGSMIGITSPSSTYGGPTGGAWPVSRTIFEAFDIAFAVPENPTISAINAGWLHQINLDRVMIRNEHYRLKPLDAEPVEPTTTTSTGLITPYKDSNGAQLGHVVIAGFYTGARISEHVHWDSFWLLGCVRALECTGGNYASGGTTMLVHECANTFYATGSGYSGSDAFGAGIPNLTLNVSRCSVEDHADSSPQWYDVDYNVYDTNDYLRGVIKYTSYKNGTAVTGIDRSHWVMGGGFVGLECIDLALPLPMARWSLASNQSITTATPTAVTFATEDYNPVFLDSEPAWFTRSGAYFSLQRSVAGLYEVTAHIRFAANTVGLRQAYIEFEADGVSPVREYGNVRIGATPSGATVLQVKAIVPILSSADRFRVMVQQTSGSNLNLEVVGTSTFTDGSVEIRKIGSYKRRGY